MKQAEENEETGIEETLDFNKPSFTFKPDGFHAYRQQGTYLVCKSCEIQHAIWVGIEKLLVGFDEKNQPILKKRKEVMGA